MNSMTLSDKVEQLDTSGLKCPLPLLKLKKKLKTTMSGTIIHFLTSDELTEQDLPQLCQLTHSEIISKTIEKERNAIKYVILKK